MPEVVVVGAGIVGLSTAFQLVQQLSFVKWFGGFLLFRNVRRVFFRILWLVLGHLSCLLHVVLMYVPVFR